MTPEELIKTKELAGKLVGSKQWHRKGQTLMMVALEHYGYVYEKYYLLTEGKAHELHEYYDRNILRRFLNG